MLPGRIDWFSSPSASAAEETPRSARPTVIAIGKFDGIHRGHQALLSRVVVEARCRGMMAGVVTFDAHPRRVLFGERHDAITSLTDRRGLLREIGLDFQFQLHACAPLFALEAEDFARQLIDALQCRVIFMGSDFRFGRRAAGDKATFARLGVAAVPVDPIVTTGSKVSSTRVRDVLRAGEIELANELLGRTHAIRGFLRHGSGSSWRMSPMEGLLVPAGATYSGRVAFRDSSSTFPALVHVPPSGDELSVEVMPSTRDKPYLLKDPVEGIAFFERRVAGWQERHGSGEAAEIERAPDWHVGKRGVKFETNCGFHEMRTHAPPWRARGSSEKWCATNEEGMKDRKEMIPVVR